MKYNQKVKMLSQIIDMEHEFFKELDLSQDNLNSEKNVNQILTKKTDAILMKMLEQKNS